MTRRLSGKGTKLTAEATKVIGKTEDASRLHNLYRKIKDAFNNAYVSGDGRIKGDTRACYVLALAVDLVDGERARLAARYLVEDIEKHNNHLSTGFIGTKDLMLALSKIGRQDVAYRLLFNDTFPPGASRSSREPPASGSGGTAGPLKRASRTRV